MLNKSKQWFFGYVLLPLASKHDEEALKSFAITMAVTFPVLFMLILPFVFNSQIPTWPIVISLVLSALYLIKAKWLYYPYLLWMFIASVFGYINTRIILAIAYYLLIVPIGLFMKMRKGLQYKDYNNENTAWVKRDTNPKKHNLKEPF